MLAQLRQQGIEGPWPSADRILVCVDSDPLSETVVRTAARLTTAQKAGWVAIHLKPRDVGLTDCASSRRAEKMMRLAERLGADTVRLDATDLASEILAYSRRNNITHIVIGRSKAGPIGRLLGRSLSREIVRRAQGLSILVVAPEAEKPPRKERLAPQQAAAWHPPGPYIASSGIAAAAVAVTVLGDMALEQVTQLPNLSMVFLLAVLLCGMRFGMVTAIAASDFSFLSYNFFFIDPRYTFTVATPFELLSLIIFLAVGS